MSSQEMSSQVGPFYICFQLSCYFLGENTLRRDNFQSAKIRAEKRPFYTQTQSMLSIWHHTCVYICSLSALLRYVQARLKEPCIYVQLNELYIAATELYL